MLSNSHDHSSGEHWNFNKEISLGNLLTILIVLFGVVGYVIQNEREQTQMRASIQSEIEARKVSVKTEKEARVVADRNLEKRIERVYKQNQRFQKRVIESLDRIEKSSK